MSIISQFKKKYTEINDPRRFLIKYDFNYLACSLEIYLNFSEPNNKTMVGHPSYWLKKKKDVRT